MVGMSQRPKAVVVLVMNANRHVLAVSRKGKLDDLGLPGGKIDPTDESPVHALCREIQEEVGIRVLPEELVFVYERVDPATNVVAWCYAFMWDPTRGLPKAVEPNTWVGFVPPERLLEASNLFHEYNLGLFKHVGLVSRLTPHGNDPGVE